MRNRLGKKFRNGAKPAPQPETEAEIALLTKLGYTHLSQGDYRRGLDFFREALRFPQSDKSRASLFTSCGSALMACVLDGPTQDRNKNAAEAEEYFQCALDCGGNLGGIYFSLMYLFDAQGDHDKTVLYAQKIINALKADDVLAIRARHCLEQEAAPYMRRMASDYPFTLN